MLISLSAVEYVNYKYNGARPAVFPDHNPDPDNELYLSKGEVFMVRFLKNGANKGGAMIKCMDDQKIVYTLSEKEITKLLEKCIHYGGKTIKENAPIRNPEVVMDRTKDNPEAYSYQEYIAPRRMRINNSADTTIGYVARGDIFGIFSKDPSKGGYFLVKSVEGIKTAKPVKISSRTISLLEERSKPYVEKKPKETKPKDIKPPKQDAAPVIEQKETVPNVANLKELHSKVNEIISQLKALTIKRISSLQDYKYAVADIYKVRDDLVDGDLKEYMHSIGLHKDMAEVLLKTIKAHYLTCVKVVKLKKQNLASETVREQIGEDDEGPIEVPFVEDDSKAKLSEALAKASQMIKDAGKQIDVPQNVDELDSFFNDLKTAYKEGVALVNAVGNKDKQLVEDGTGYLKGLFTTYSEKFAAKREALLKQAEEKTGEDVDTGEEDMSPDVSDEDYDSIKFEDDEDEGGTVVEDEPVVEEPSTEEEPEEKSLEDDYDNVKFEDDEDEGDNTPMSKDQISKFLDDLDEGEEKTDTTHLYDENLEDDYADFGSDDYDPVIGDLPEIDSEED